MSRAIESSMFIICPIAGVGSRLHPITISKPKALVKVAGKRIIDHLMEKLEKTFPQGTEICFIVGYKKKSMMEYISSHFSDYFKIYYVEQIPAGFNRDIPYFSGLGDAINLAGKWASGKDVFIFLSDRLPMEDYTPMVEEYYSNGWDGMINVQQVPDPQHYGCVQINNKGEIEKIVEKPTQPPSNLAVAGAYLFGKAITPQLFKALEIQSNKPLTPGKEHQFTNIIQDMISQHNARIGINEMKSPILDFGRTIRLLQGNQILLDKTPNIEGLITEYEARDEITNTKIIPPTYIGKNCKISDSIIGPYVSLGNNASIKRCNLQNTVIGDQCILKRIITTNSVMGDFVSVEDLVKNSMIIGDSSSLSRAEKN